MSKFEFRFLESSSEFTGVLIDFFNLICIMLISITFLISYWMIYILKNHNFKKNELLNKYNLNFILRKNDKLRSYINTNLKDRNVSYLELYDLKDNPKLEATWCVVPLGFVSIVSYPSIGLEYGISPDMSPLVTLKVIANQWYWLFELEAKASPGLLEGNDNYFFFKSDLYKLFVETYGDMDKFYEGLGKADYQILSKEIEVNLKKGEEPGFFRLLAVDNKIVLPINTPIKLIVTSVDVLHSFAMPAWGVKIDAIPGRLSEQVVIINRPGLYWGQCSELCGPYHGFMPVTIEITSYPVFLKSFFN